MIHRILQFILWWIFKIIYPTKFVGKENLPKGACIIASNHTSNLDGVLVGLNTWERKKYLAKKELFDKKFVGFILKHIGGIKIDRSISDVGAIKECLKVLKEGKKLMIFPEGTRTKSESMELGEVKHGVAMFAIKAKVKIVPFYINRRPKAFHKTVMTYGEPFELSQFYGMKVDSEVLSEAGEIVTQKMEELREKCIKSLTK